MTSTPPFSLREMFDEHTKIGKKWSPEFKKNLIKRLNLFFSQKFFLDIEDLENITLEKAFLSLGRSTARAHLISQIKDSIIKQQQYSWSRQACPEEIHNLQKQCEAAKNTCIQLVLGLSQTSNEGTLNGN